MTGRINDQLPGQSNPDFARVVSEYLSNFSYHRVKKEYAVREELYQWCADHLGEQYKEWFIHEGGKYDKWWTVNIRSPKRTTWFILRWNDILLESFDRSKTTA
jgi:hypothetical protein